MARLLGVPVAVDHEYDNGSLTVQASATVAGYPVRVWATLDDPGAVDQARVLVAGMETGQ